jgi:glutamate synthase domain-containing protein 2
MVATGITPDFITVDGGEGGTGAAPVEMTNSVGMPLRDGLIFTHNALVGTGMRDRIRIIASGKSISAFHALRLLALGADTINAARAMMFALGCLQARHCNQDTCPTGIATQDLERYKALDVDIKADRVANYQRLMIENLMELIGAAGMSSLDELRPWHINHRVNGTDVKDYAELYPAIASKSLLSDADMPESLRNDWQRADPNKW